MTDHDIKTIHYVRLDIDIKKQCLEFMGLIPDEDDIITFTNEIKEKLETNEFLKDWSYIVYSGGGCHIYYSNTVGVDINDRVTPKVWQLAMKRIYTLYDDTIGDEEYLYSDKAVCNTARIMRLP